MRDQLRAYEQEIEVLRGQRDVALRALDLAMATLHGVKAPTLQVVKEKSKG